LTKRRATRDAVDTTTLCRERDLELDTAMEMIYRKAGRVKWGREVIEVVLDPYRYTDPQRAMEETCHRFNEAQVCWRDRQSIRIHVARETGFQLCGC
jgi:hypothetical protein